jgi:hypothetical protein
MISAQEICVFRYRHPARPTALAGWFFSHLTDFRFYLPRDPPCEVTREFRHEQVLGPPRLNSDS